MAHRSSRPLRAHRASRIAVLLVAATGLAFPGSAIAGLKDDLASADELSRTALAALADASTCDIAAGAQSYEPLTARLTSASSALNGWSIKRPRGKSHEEIAAAWRDIQKLTTRATAAATDCQRLSELSPEAAKPGSDKTLSTASRVVASWSPPPEYGTALGGQLRGACSSVLSKWLEGPGGRQASAALVVAPSADPAAVKASLAVVVGCAGDTPSGYAAAVRLLDADQAIATLDGLRGC